LTLFKEAIEDYDKAIGLDSTKFMVYWYRGRDKANLGFFHEAIKDYNKAIDLNPYYMIAYIDRALAKDKLILYKEAIEDYDKAIRLDSTNSLTYWDRGYTKYELNLYQEAIKDYNKAIELNPNYAYAFNSRGQAEQQLGLYEKAVKDYDKVIELNPSYVWPYVNKGIIWYISGIHQKAIDEYNKAIERDPNCVDAFYNRGLAEKALGLNQEAEIDFTKAIKLNHDNVLAKTELDNLKNLLSFNPIQKPKIWAVAVGLSVYENEKILTPLNSPVTNALEFARFLERINFINGKIPVLLNEKADKESILDTLKSTFLDKNKVNKNDMIIFYYSGHGEAIGDQSGICPYEYVNPQQLITDQEILDILQKSPARHKICVIEACKTKVKAQSPLSEGSLDHFNEERGKIPGSIVFITSTKVGEKSFEVPKMGTIFSYYFLKGIEGEADVQNDGIITVRELFDYLKANVIKDTQNNQIPQINKEGYESNIPILVYK
jgi:tetratricopeptide (TPR) repeat protein